jgi:hypothetical protein
VACVSRGINLVLVDGFFNTFLEVQDIGGAGVEKKVRLKDKL